MGGSVSYNEPLMHNAGHKTILEIVVVTFDLKYVPIKL
jgi:thymidylate synthase ThyX